MNNLKQNGFGLVEIIIVTSLSFIVLLGVTSYLNSSLKIASEGVNKVEALSYARSSLEQARALRDADWSNISGLTLDSNYYFDEVGSIPDAWVSVLGQKTIGKYTIWVVPSSVLRDGNDDIALAGTIDPKTIKITSSVSYYSSGSLKQIDLFAYLTNFR